MGRQHDVKIRMFCKRSAVKSNVTKLNKELRGHLDENVPGWKIYEPSVMSLLA